MREQAVIAHADAQAGGDPPENDGYQKCLPGKEKQSGDSGHVEYAHENRSDPVNFAVVLRFFLQDFE
jgi:hypothetical protein